MFPCLAKHRFANKVTSVFHPQVVNKTLKNHIQLNKTLPKISCEKVIDVLLSFYFKLASKSVPKIIKNEPWLPYWSSVVAV